MNNFFRIIHGCKRKAALVTAALLLCLFASPLPLHAFEVTIVKDTDIKAYEDAIQGFTSACGCSTREIDLSDKDDGLEKAVKAHPDAFFVVGTEAFRKAEAIKNFPVIYTMVMPSETADPLGSNVSGVSMDISPETYLSAMTKLFPGVRRIGVLSDPEQTGPFVREAEAVARARGITLVVKTIRDPQEAPALLAQLRGKIDVLWMLPDSTLINSESVEYLMLFSFQNNVPVFSFSKQYVDRGAVAALSITPYDLGVQAGNIARLLSQGGKGPLRVYAENPHLSVNRKVAAKIGVRIGNGLKRADETGSNE